ncbi:MAG: hydroxymethylbilane synthase [Deltaproteobacteria bacterium]|mgnify:CR=1 FL=1|nr:hydroxymethylbilane synthase [Deltaproteobacteria bacterium]
MGEPLRIGTRRSRLALWQARQVAMLLEAAGAATELVGIDTAGDRVLDLAIGKIGDKGVFTKELEERLRTGEIHLAVHSAKDLPSSLPPGLEICAFAEREAAHDVLLCCRRGLDIDNPRIPLRVGSSSVRRIAFLKRLFSHLQVLNVRGNLQTRIGKMKSGLCDVLMLAGAGVGRMGYEHLVCREFSPELIPPPAGQGAIAVEVSLSLGAARRRLIREAVNHPPTERAVVAERAFLRVLQGGCSIPAFAHAEFCGDELRLDAGIISLDGQRLIRERGMGAAAASASLGETVGRRVLEKGGTEILRAIKEGRDRGSPTKQGEQGGIKGA